MGDVDWNKEVRKNEVDCQAEDGVNKKIKTWAEKLGIGVEKYFLAIEGSIKDQIYHDNLKEKENCRKDSTDVERDISGNLAQGISKTEW